MCLKLVILCSILASVWASQNGFLDGDLDIADGVKLVSVPVSNNLDDETGRSFGSNTVLSRMAKFLQGHELQVKLPNLIEKEKLNEIFSESLKALDENYGENAVSGRQHHNRRGGNNGAALLAMMMAKALGAAGIGALGLLTMKALGVSALALMLSAIVGLKKLSSHGESQDDHKVIYAGHGHHRRRRDADDFDTPLPYKGWSEYSKQQ